MATSLVTGGAGFMGAHLTRALLDRGDEVTVLDDLSEGFTENIPDGASFVEGSVTDDALVSELFAEKGFQYVYHLAAYAAEGLSHFIKRFNYTNNVLGSVTLINAAVNHDVDCFVFTSSIAVYGGAQAPMTESMRPEPEDPYGIAKLAVEQDLAASKEMFDLDYVIFRPHNVYGEWQNMGDRYRNVLGIFMNQIMNEQPLSIFGDGEQSRAFSYVQDVIPAIAEAPLVPEAREEIFNVGADVPYSVSDLADMVRVAMGVPDHPVRYLDARNEVKHAFSDHSKLRGTFSLPEATPLSEGLQRTVDWAKKRGPAPLGRVAEIEIERNLPPLWLEPSERLSGGQSGG
jgi:UDP-glucose 4-epimerase